MIGRRGKRLGGLGGLALALLWVLRTMSVAEAPVEGLVVDVLDGDTVRVRLSGEVKTLRYLYIDTPEMHHPQRGEEEFGEAAAEFNRKLVMGRVIRIEFDKEREDKYGRLLGTPMVNLGGRWVRVNEALASRGLGLAMVVSPNDSGAWRIRGAVLEAKEKGLGLWGPSKDGSRGFTEAQVKAFAGKLRGRWIRAEIRVKKVARSRGGSVRIFGDRGFLHLLSYPGVYDFSSISPGDRLVIWGCLTASSRGWHIRWVDPAQKMN
ncbi:MAG: thermonuclease family protein [Thermanaerothrix sp.]|nr:thermonuclease family protein [Thermanaerothrix sp.]